MQSNQPLTTVSGKPVTMPVAFRLTMSYYQQLKTLAGQQGTKVSKLLQTWVIEKLEDQTDE